MSDGTLFCVDSYGATATQWLAACLNAHPLVVAAHSFHWPPSVPRFATPATPEEELWGRENLVDLGEFFSRLRRSFPEKLCFGTVHAFPIQTALAHRAAPIRAGYLLRHPVLQIESIAAHWRHRCALDGEFERRTIDGFCHNATQSFMAQIAHLAAAVDTVSAAENRQEVLLLIAMVDVLESHRRPFLDHPVPIFTMEQMTTDVGYLTKLVRSFTGDLPGVDAVVASAFATQAINRHRARAAAPEEVFAAWPAWAQRLFRDSFVQSFAERYAALGYDLGEETRTRPAAASRRADYTAGPRSTAAGATSAPSRAAAPPLRPVEISTIPRSGTWYLKYFFQFMLAQLRGEAPLAIGEIYRRVKSTAVLDLAAEDPRHEVFSFAAPLGFSPLVVNHLVCAGFWQLEAPLRELWTDLAADLGALEFQQSLRPTLERFSPYREAGARICFVYRHPLDLLVAHARMFADQVAAMGDEVRIPFNPHWPLHLDFLSDTSGDPFEFYVRHLRETRLIDAYALQMLTFVAMQREWPDRVAIFRYEDIQAAPRERLAELLAHCGADVAADAARRAAFDSALASTTKDAMKGYENALGHSLSGPTYFFGGAKQNHITRAAQRDWRTALPPADISWARSRLAQLGLAADWFDGFAAADAASPCAAESIPAT